MSDEQLATIIEKMDKIIEMIELGGIKTPLTRRDSQGGSA